MKNVLNEQNLQKPLLECLNTKRSIVTRTSNYNGENSEYCIQKNVVVVCFGTPLVSGDALGPLVADKLREGGAPVFVYGTTDSPISAKNMADKLEFIRAVHKDDVIIAVDASLGDKEGGVVVRRDGVCPAAVRGRRKRFGDVGVLGVVAPNGDDALMNLMAADFNFVDKLAASVANAILGVIA